MTLREYAAPIRRLPVDKVTTDDVLAVLKPIWTEKPETASRVRGRIERVLDAAKAQGLEAHRWMWTFNRAELVDTHPLWYSKNRNGESCADFEAL